MLSLEVYDKDPSRVLIASDTPGMDSHRLKTLASGTYSVTSYEWTAPLTWGTVCAIKGIFGEDVVAGPKLVEWTHHEYNFRILPSFATRLKVDINDLVGRSAIADHIASWRDSGEAFHLYPYQEAAVVFMAGAKRVLLGDEPGTGKTIMAARTLRLLEETGKHPFPCLVVCPNNMVYTWQRELEKWFPSVDTVTLKGPKAQRSKMIAEQHDVYIINIEGVRGHSRLAPYGSTRQRRCIVCNPRLPDVPYNRQANCEHCPRDLNLKNFRTVIVDEAHRMKNPLALQTRAIWAMVTSNTEYVYGLTGTPLANAPHDLWSILHMLSSEEWPSKSKYIDRYCLTAFNPWGLSVVGLKQETKKEFFSIIDPRFRRMPKAAVLPQLPLKTYTERFVEMSTKQAKAYREMADGMIARIDSGFVVATNPLVQMIRGLQFASSYCELDEKGDVIVSEPSNKIDTLMEILEEREDEQIVIFAMSRQLIDLAYERCFKLGYSCGRITGGQSAEQRDLEMQEFQLGKRRLMFATIAAGGVGITLNAAHTAIFLQRSWSMVDNTQAEDRVHRIGSEKFDMVEIIDIISTGTLEEGQRVLLSEKSERLEEIVRDRQTLAHLLRGEKV